MNHELADDPNDRLVDVLLEEALRASLQRAVAAAPVAPQGTTVRARWFAFAAALLGLSAVVATMLLREAPHGVAPVQQPQDPTPSKSAPWADDKRILVIKDAELRALAPEFRRMRVRMLTPGADGISRRAIPGAETVVEDADAVRAFVASLPPADDGMWGADGPLPWDTWIAFELADGRHVDAFHRTGTRTLDAFPLRIVDVGEAVVSRVGELVRTAAENLRISLGIAENKDQLARVPATARAIRCWPPDNGSAGSLFARFPQLEHLELTHTYSLGTGPTSIQVPNFRTTVLRELQLVPHLRHLRIPGYMLDDERAAELAALPKLTSLRVDGPFGRPASPGNPAGATTSLTATGIRALAAKLTGLEVVVPDLTVVDFEPFVAAGKLQALTLFGDPLPPATLARLARMPSLTTLSFGGIDWTDEHLRVLAGTKLLALRLQHTDATIDGLLQLPRSLRLLDVQRQGFTAKQREQLAGRWPAAIAVGPGFAAEPADSPFVDPFAGFGTTRR